MNKRVAQVSEQIKKQIAEYIIERINSQGAIISVLEVFLMGDFSSASVLVSVFPSDNEKEILNQLINKKDEIQKILGKKLVLKQTPVIIFKLAKPQDQGNRVDQLLEEI